jgi:hypothetical protein
MQGTKFRKRPGMLTDKIIFLTENMQIMAGTEQEKL